MFICDLFNTHRIFISGIKGSYRCLSPENNIFIVMLNSPLQGTLAAAARKFDSRCGAAEMSHTQSLAQRTLLSQYFAFIQEAIAREEGERAASRAALGSRRSVCVYEIALHIWRNSLKVKKEEPAKVIVAARKKQNGKLRLNCILFSAATNRCALSKCIAKCECVRRSE